MEGINNMEKASIKDLMIEKASTENATIKRVNWSEEENKIINDFLDRHPGWCFTGVFDGKAIFITDKGIYYGALICDIDYGLTTPSLRCIMTTHWYRLYDDFISKPLKHPKTSPFRSVR